MTSSLRTVRLARILRTSVADVEPMLSLDRITDTYGADDGEYVVIYALSNLSHWRHPNAKDLKDELKLILHEHDPKRYKMPK